MRFLVDEDFNNNLIRGLLRRNPGRLSCACKTSVFVARPTKPQWVQAAWRDRSS